MELSKVECIIQKKLNDGDVSGLEIIFHGYYNDLCRYVMIFLRDEQVAKNIVQDLFVSIWENRLNIQFHKSIEAYLYQACRLNTLNYIRNRDRREKKNIELGNNTSIEIEGPDANFELHELEKILDEAIALLPDRCRQIFIMSRQRDLSYAEIAKQLGLSVKTVDNQINKAIKKIKLHVSKQYPVLLINPILFEMLN